MSVLDTLQAKFDALITRIYLLKPSLMPNPDTFLPDWSIIPAAHHNVRVVADLQGLTYDQKEILAACIMQESGFNINAINHNTNGSTDWGICQYNDDPRNGWIGPNGRFSDVKYVLTHPQECVEVMAQRLKTTGNLNPWVSYKSGAYLKYKGKV